MYYAKIGDYEKAAKKWNGSGYKTGYTGKRLKRN